MADREWMYSGWSCGKAPSNEWIENTNNFLDRAFSMVSLVENDTIKCPCALCRNYVRHTRFNVEMHLCKHGFREDYRAWTAHGEIDVEDESDESFEECDRMHDMLANLADGHPLTNDEVPTASPQAFYRMVDNANEPAFENSTHSALSAIARLLALKSQYNMSIAHFEANLELIHELLPLDSKIPNDFYQSKKLLEGLGMPYQKIDVCYNNCMLYYKDNISKEKSDGAVDKAIVLAHSKSGSIRPPDPDHYESVLNENAKLKMTNDILTEENRVHRALFMSVFDRIGTEPPTELLQRPQDIDARRHQATGSHGGSHSVDERRNNHNAEDEDDDDDYSYHESDGDDCSYREDNHDVHYSTDDDDHTDDDDDDACLEDGDDSSSFQSDDDHRSTEQ